MFGLSGINWIAVIVGVVFSNALGFLWYGPLFGKPWMAALGKRQEDMQSSPTMYIWTVVMSLITMIVLAAAVNAFGSAGVVQGAVLGLALYVGLQGAATYIGTVFEGRSRTLWWINGLYNLVVFAVMGAVFAIW
jgi:Protein of unknown function (DUF1761)